MLTFESVKTNIATPPQYDFFKLWNEANISIKNKNIIVITTKILSIHQGNCVKKDKSITKLDLVKLEAEKIFYEANKFNQPLTIKEATFVGSAGIDESNGNGYYVLWPKNILDLLHEIYKFILKKYNIQDVGIIAIDSVVLPMRKGTIGRSIASIGFQANIDCKENPDLFGKPLEITTINVADNLSGAASFLMGESNECKPIVIIDGTENLLFNETFSSKDSIINQEDDMYNIFLKQAINQ